MTTLSISLLGGFSVLRAGEPITAFGYDKVRALLAFLAVEADRPHRRDRLAALFWPEHPRAPGLQSLSQALYHLRHAIGDRDARPQLLLLTPQTVQFNLASDFELDTLALQNTFKTATAHPHATLHRCDECLARLHAAVALYRGSFLAGFTLPDSAEFDEWQTIQREHFQAIALEMLRSLWLAHDLRGEHGQALTYARQRLALDPWQEDAHREVMQTLAALGDRAAALAQFETCRRVLAAELGIALSATTLALYRQLCVDGAGAPVGRTTLPLLPAPLTPLVGRACELSTIQAYLLDPACRLLSLVGPGGSGKTHLALAAAAELGAAFADGVAWVALGGVDSALPVMPSLVDAIAQSLRFAFAPQGNPQRQLLDYLRPKHLLLLVDSVEHLLPGAPLLAELLAAAPNLKIMVTSRSRLNIQGEYVLPIGGLPLPAAASADQGVVDADSVALFLLHARRVSADFNPSPEDLAAIAEICTAVDGMPLAIILAAAWMNTLSPVAIAAQIIGQTTGQVTGQLQPAAETALAFLAVDWADLPARQRSMRTVLDQSWQLLTPEEQQVLARLAVFRSGFTYPAAQDVAHASLHHLRALVEKSWLHRSAAGRYELHELLRQYAEAKLQAWPGARSETYTRHCTHFAAAVAGWARDLQGKRQLVALAELALETDNARTAWTWAAQRADAAGLGKMVDGLCGFFDWHGLCRQGCELCSQALTHLGQSGADGEQAIVQARLLAWQGHFARLLGDSAAAGAALAQALTLLDAAGEVPGEVPGAVRAVRAFVLHEQALLMIVADRVQAREICLACLNLYRAAQDLSGVARVLNTLADLSYCLSQYDQGLAMVEEALAVARGLGDRRLIAESLHRRGLIHATKGEVDLAGRLHEESNAICREIGDNWGLAEGELELASVWMYGGRFGEAAACYTQAADRYAALGGRSGYTTAVHLLAWACTNLGEYATARQHYDRAEELWQADNDRHGVGISRMSLGEIALATGHYAEARALLSAGIDLLAAVQQRDEEAIGLGDLAATLHALGQPAAARASVRRALLLGQAIGAVAPIYFALEAYALMLADGGDPARGLELYTFAARHPYIGNSRYHADCFGRRIEALAAGLSPAEVAAARGRALAGDTATVVQGVLAELGAGAADLDTIDRRQVYPPAVEPYCQAVQAA